MYLKEHLRAVAQRVLLIQKNANEEDVSRQDLGLVLKHVKFQLRLRRLRPPVGTANCRHCVPAVVGSDLVKSNVRACPQCPFSRVTATRAIPAPITAALSWTADHWQSL